MRKALPHLFFISKIQLLFLGFLCLATSLGYCDDPTPTMAANETTITQDAPEMVSPVDALNSKTGNTIGNPPLNEAGIYPQGGSLLIDRSVTLPNTLTVSSVTVTSMTVLGGLVVPNGVNSKDAVALGQLTGVRVLQVVTCSATQSDSTTSTSFADTSTTCSITPTSTTSKMLIYAWALTADTRGDVASGFFTITGTTNGARCDASVGCASINPSVAGNGLDHIFFGTTDTPGTITAQTYKVQYKTGSATATIRWGVGATAWLQIIEIG